MNATIAELEAAVKELDATVLTDRSTHDKVEADYIKLTEANVALKAKLEFMRKNYDYTHKVKQLSVDDFQQLVNTNELVNNSITGFLERLQKTKTDYADQF